MIELPSKKVQWEKREATDGPISTTACDDLWTDRMPSIHGDESDMPSFGSSRRDISSWDVTRPKTARTENLTTETVEEQNLAVMEDLRVTSLLFERLKFCEFIVFLFATAGSIAGIVGYDAEYEAQKGGPTEVDLEAVSKLLYNLGTVTMFILVAFIWVRGYLELEWLKARRLVSQEDNLYTSGILFYIILDIAFAIVHPSVIHYGMDFKSYNEPTDTHHHILFNSYLSVTQSFIRLAFASRCVFIYSPYMEGRAQRTCDMNGAEANRLFALKCLMRQYPLPVLMVTFFTFLLVTGNALRVFERPLEEVGDRVQTFSQIQNAIWCSLLTMTTVGYGDYYPVTGEGRIVASLASIGGVALVSLMVVAIQQILEFSPGETLAFDILKRLRVRKRVEKAAVHLLELTFLNHKAQRDETNTKKAGRWKGKLVRGTQLFAKRRRRLNSMLPMDGNMLFLRKQSEEMKTELTDIRTENQSLRNQIANMNTKMDRLLLLLDHSSMSEAKELSTMGSSPASEIK